MPNETTSKSSDTPIKPTDAKSASTADPKKQDAPVKTADTKTAPAAATKKQDAPDAGRDRGAGAVKGLDLGDDVTRLHNIADGAQLMEDAFPRCVDDPLRAVAADDAGDAGVRDGDALPDDASQTMAALGLHHEINVLPRSEARAEGDG